MAIDRYIEANGTQSSAVATKYGYPIGTWCVSKITNMAGLFNGKQTFNEDLNGWDVSSVTTMER